MYKVLWIREKPSMSYDMRFSILKRESIEKWSDGIKIEDLDIPLFSELFESGLFAYLYPDEYEIPPDLEGRDIFSSQSRILKGILDINNNEAIVLTQDKFDKLCNDIREYLTKTRLIDIINLDEYDLHSKIELIELYKILISIDIDWETEVVAFDHDW